MNKDNTRSNMGNLCCRTIPNINLSCINNGMISSCCKSDSESTEMPTFYKWIFTMRHNERIFHNTSAAWFENFAQCNEAALHNIQMCCVESEEIVQLFIYEWKVNTQQSVRLVYQKKMMTSRDKMK